MAPGAELSAEEPLFRKLVETIRHVLAAEYSELKHLLGCQLGPKLGIEVLAHRFR